MDFNAYLKNVTTAREDHGADSEAWLRRKKRRARLEGESTPQKAAKGEAVGLDMAALQEELKRERFAAAVAAQAGRGAHANVSSEESTSRAHRILEHVMTRELGGRHNAFYGPSDTSRATAATAMTDTTADAAEDDMNAIPRPERLAAERARLVAAAAWDIRHVVHAGGAASSPAASEDDGEEGDGAGSQRAYSTPHRERAAGGVVLYRKTLRVCDVRADLVGGLLAGTAPHLRAYALKLIRAGLRGEAWTRPVADDKGTTPVAVAEGGRGDIGSTIAGAAPITLFGDVAASANGGDGAAPGFSLDGFLNAVSSEDDVA